MKMKNQMIIDSLVCLLRHIQQDLPSLPQLEMKRYLGSAKYLIGQSIRQYDIPREQRHLSVAAFNIWNKISKDKDIMKYSYRDSVICDNLTEDWEYCKYIGSSDRCKSEKVSPGGKIIFNDVFHEDHVVPVKLIVENLLSLEDITAATVESVLKKMHLCTILKSEDHLLGRTAGRTLCYEETIQNVYEGNVSIFK